MKFAHCPSCGRRHEPNGCIESPRGADAWNRVLAARAKACPPSPTDLTAANA